MDRFNAKTRCLKCGGEASTEWHMQDDDRCDIDLRDSEHLHRTCTRCGYDWLEKCLDVE